MSAEKRTYVAMLLWRMKQKIQEQSFECGLTDGKCSRPAGRLGSWGRILSARSCGPLGRRGGEGVSTVTASVPVPQKRPLQAGSAPRRGNRRGGGAGKETVGAFSPRSRLRRAAGFRAQSAQPSWPGAFHEQESPPSQHFGGLARWPSLTPALVPQEDETLSWRPRNCSFRPRKDPPRPWSCARLRFVVRSLADAQAVLSRLPSPERFPGTRPTLELLAAARRDVGACLELVRPGSWRKSLRPPRRRPQTRRADSPRCYEASVIFSLLRLLTWDLKLVASSGPCL
ncbi:uncharacterized protein LOC117795238 [Ailuropoda melanoleuca]|uniref:uncharacterized protein LOC117795238 n=1 Tax=Ailuropoda melanoleuca TaxID=9646 RepID=UPI001494E1C0|nr:uncharacterized protein LOC117795238 [Ailuropoda melanoleuca]